MATIEINAVSKSYGEQPVLFGVDFNITDGEFVVLLGPSGCGKSTLLRMIAGLETITSGTIGIDGRVVNNVAAKERDVAMVFQTYALYPHMTVAENMGFSLRVAGNRKSDIAVRVAAAAKILALTDYLDRFPRHLSGGQRQRVAMGRAIVRDPKVFLFDEPLSNLDAKLRVQMRTEIKELHQRLGATIVYVTHDQIEAMTMADRVVVMRDGYIQQIGSPLEIYDRPVNAFVAGFIGSPSMNLMSGTIRQHGTGHALEMAGGHTLPVPSGPAAALDGKRVTLGIRPEHLSLAAPGDANPINADVVVIEPTGAVTFIALRVGGHDITAVMRERIDARPGTSLSVTFDGDLLHFFDDETGERLNLS